MKTSTQPILLPERVAMLWGGFVAFVLAFSARLLASGDPASAVFSGCVGCLVGGWFGRLAASYLNSNLRPTPVVDDQTETDEAIPEAAPRQT